MSKKESNSNPVKTKEKQPKVGGMNSDTKIILSVVGGMILVCAALIVYYFYGVNNQVVATYDNGKVTRGEYEMYYKLFQPMLTYYGYEEDKINGEVLDKIIIDKLVLEEVKKEKITLTKDEKKEIDEEFKTDETKKYFEGLGITLEKAKSLYYDDAKINKYIEENTESATEEKIKDFIISTEGEKANLNTYSTSYILYSTTEAKDDEAKAKVKTSAEETLTRLKNGEAFATVGEELNTAGTAQYASEYTVSLNGSAVKAFEDAVAKLGVGQMTQEIVVSDEYGYFIIKVDSITENGRLKDQSAYVNLLLAKMKEEANIKSKDKKIEKIVKKISVNSSETSSSK